MKRQKRNEKIFLINTGLDLIYMGIGGWMMHRKSANPELNSGFGSSILIQGGFLFAFDAVMYSLHRKNRLKNTNYNL